MWNLGEEYGRLSTNKDPLLSNIKNTKQGSIIFIAGKISYMDDHEGAWGADFVIFYVFSNYSY